MTAEEKVEKIKAELQKMYDDGELQVLLSENTDVETLRFLSKVKDYYLQKQQKEVIARKDFVI